MKIAVLAKRCKTSRFRQHVLAGREAEWNAFRRMFGPSACGGAQQILTGIIDVIQSPTIKIIQGQDGPFFLMSLVHTRKPSVSLEIEA